MLPTPFGGLRCSTILAQWPIGIKDKKWPVSEISRHGDWRQEAPGRCPRVMKGTSTR